jgi:hypothetical protein
MCKEKIFDNSKRKNIKVNDVLGQIFLLYRAENVKKIKPDINENVFFLFIN